MSRIIPPTRDSIPAADRPAFDEMIKLSGGSMPTGPGAVAMHSPEFALRRNPLSNYMRWELAIPQDFQEIAILVTAKVMDCPYVWNAHAALARQAGVPNELIAWLRSPKSAAYPDWSTGISSKHWVFLNYALHLLRDHRISKHTFEDVTEIFDVQHLVELTALMGHYVQNCLFLNAFEIDMPGSISEPKLPLSRGARAQMRRSQVERPASPLDFSDGSRVFGRF